MRVALTGGIATGKSYVLRALEARGIPSLDADALVHTALGPGTATTEWVRRRFGAVVIAEDGGVDRRRLGERVFADAAARRELEAAIHPGVYDAIRTWLAGPAAAVPLAVADVPLLYETGRENLFDKVVVVACDPATQLQRLVDRDGLSREAARHRLEAQWPIGDKVARADHVIWTDGSFADTDRQIDRLLPVLADGEPRG